MGRTSFACCRAEGEVRVTKAEVDEMLLKQVAKWQLPDAVEFVEELPLTATGKVSKLTLRQNFKINFPIWNRTEIWI